VDLSQYAELFLAESREHLGVCNQLLLEWERAPSAREPVQGIFRAVHTVKGMAATMGYARVADLAHRMETLLDTQRRGAKPAGDELLQLLFRARDALEHAVELSVAGREAEVAVAALGAELDRAARRLGPRARARTSAPMPALERPAERGRAVQVTLRAEAPLKGGRALIVLRRMQTLGTVHSIVPPAAAFEAEDFDGVFAFRLESSASADAVAAAVRGAGDVERVSVGGVAADAPAPVEAAGVEAVAPPSRHVRVDLRRLDALMNQIGELTTARGRLGQLAAERRDPALDDISLQVSRLAGELQAEIIQARMTPVWQVFDRFPRLVRDLARQLDKQVAFRIEGKEIELDRAILDELGDPLVHLLRNAVDHGIEPPDERRRRRKPAEGRITLSAVRERASVAIRVADDGRGIDRKKILALAKREGMVEAHTEALTDDQLLRVLARPGFSTAQAVTSVSGRGVGIDVVVTRLRTLGGSIEIRSELGQGTTFTLRLPVTLAIVRALIAAVGGERYALPLTYVAEAIELGSAALTQVEGREAMVLRDRVVPLVHLRHLLGVTDRAVPPKRPVIVLEMGERRTGLVVDGMLAQQEIVVKSFEAPKGTLPVFSGATILGDGVPALILDAGGLV
jgi:two-component system chemotaxis sensor kinase CheA